MDSRKSLERGLNKSFTVEESATMGRRERQGEGNDENGEREREGEGRFNADVANFLPSVHASLCLNLPPPPFPVAQDGPFRGVARENLCRMIVGASGSTLLSGRRIVCYRGSRGKGFRNLRNCCANVHFEDRD